MGFAVMHLDKSGSSSSGSLGNHIDRKFTPKNADESREHLNRFYDPKTKKFSEIKPGETLNQRIKARISAGYKANRKIRSNAVKSINFILTGTHEDMMRISANPKTESDWIKKNIEFLAEEFGGIDNIVSFALHKDERTPHIHATIVPITKDGRLSARDFVYGRKRLQELQSIYAGKMSSFGLERGQRESKATHMTTAEFYKTVNESEDFKKKAQNLPPEEKTKLIEILLRENAKISLERKKKPKFDKKYRRKLE